MTAPTARWREPTPIMECRSDSVAARIVDVAGRPAVELRVEGGKHHGAVDAAGAEAMERAIRTATDLGIPFVAYLDTAGADLADGVASLHGWGRLARALVDASGVVPTIIVVTGACVSGPALCLGLVDHVVMTAEAFAYVSGPDAVAELTGVNLDRHALGGADVHDRFSGVASFVVEHDDDVDTAVEALLAYLPPNSLADPPPWPTDDPVDRDCAIAARVVPTTAQAGYDVRTVLADVLDAESFLELRAAYAPNVVIGLGHLDGRAVGVVANQPASRAGTLDIEASRKAARFVQWCDAFNVPLLTIVDTPGFEPGKDLEWRGMIRHGAQLVHAYAEATVPRLSLVLRKAYGGAYIVMDSKGLGNDWCAAWPQAQIAVMGAPGAVQILHGKRLAALDDADHRASEQQRLVDEYEDRFSNPHAAAERGYVDVVLDPLDTRRVLAAALGRYATKRETVVSRRHSNQPL
ncbi:MAG: carboxyl transferase domain-containing protein [Acidimicrobiia bacterium]